jgi:hypothetical protein
MSNGFSTTSHRVLVSDCNHSPSHDWSERNECRRQRLVAEAANRKRVKAVFDTGEIPHLWAHKVQPSARNVQGNLYFENETIYSYGSHFPIARHVTNKAGRAAVLFSTGRYSVTTSSHISAVSSAIPSDVLVLHVPKVLAGSGSMRDRGDHADNLAAYRTGIDAALIKASRGRSSFTREDQYGMAVRNRTEYNAYIKFFGLRNKPLAAIPALDSKVLQAIKAREAQRVKAESAERKRAEAERLVRLAAAIQDWRDGKPLTYSLPYDTPAMLRISGNELETSKGARVPISHAKRALVLIRAVVSRGVAWHSNGHTCHVGHYRIDSIQADGTVKAGCHVIARDEWERIAPALDAITATVEQDGPTTA